MKITQNPSFTKTAILLESRDEADAFFALLTMNPQRERNEPSEKLKVRLTNWFSNNYR